MGAFILGIIALTIGVVGTKAGLVMANDVIHSTKGAADPTQVDQAYTAAATTTVLGLVVLVANLIFLLVVILRGGSSSGETSLGFWKRSLPLAKRHKLRGWDLRRKSLI